MGCSVLVTGGQDKNHSINYKEFVAWARGKHEVMKCLEGIERVKLQTADNHSDSEDSAAEVMQCVRI
jgi:hypothetical protein